VALPTVAWTGAQVAGYKVKCMLAEPKSNRGTRTESASGETSSPATSAGRSADAASHREQRGVSSPFQAGASSRMLLQGRGVCKRYPGKGHSGCWSTSQKFVCCQRLLLLLCCG